MSAHTPGPWAIDWNISRLDIFSADSKFLVCTLRRSALSPSIDDAAKANAKLIAAAPELLAALKDVVGWVPGSSAFFTDGSSAAVERARAAIAKAEGRA